MSEQALDGKAKFGIGHEDKPLRFSCTSGNYVHVHVHAVVLNGVIITVVLWPTCRSI